MKASQVYLCFWNQTENSVVLRIQREISVYWLKSSKKSHGVATRMFPILFKNKMHKYF